MQLISNHIPNAIQCPYFLSEDKAETMQRYRIYINTYNAKVPSLNKAVKEYNNTVASFIQCYKLSQQTVIAQKDFEKLQTNDTQHKWLSILEYNALVETTNGGMLFLKKKNHQEVKQPQESIFEVILWLYAKQLAELREHLKSLGSDVNVSFPKAQITSTAISNFKKQGEKRILYSSRTIRNHIHRLRKAGVLVKYQFKGSKKPVHYFINEAIFVFRDNRKSVTENQQVSDLFRKKVPYNSVDTRTFTKEIIKKVGNVDNHSHDKEVVSFAAENSSKNKNTYKNTTNDNHQKISNQNASKLSGGENFPKNELSEYLRNQILYKTVFLNALTAHHYDNYSFSSSNMTRRLDTESINGVMSKEEFRELLLQLFIKIAAPIWKGKNVYYGSWHKAYIQIDDEYLRNPNGSIPRKETLLYLFGFLVYRIGRAKRFFKSKKVYRIHFPCIYFDATRKLPSEGGFAYTVEWLKQYQKYQDLRATRKQLNAGKAGARRRQKTNEEKVRDQVKLYVKGKIALPQVYKYIETNKGIPNYFIGEVPRLLNLLTNKEFDLYE
ncbi:hypothetical protein IMCC3317_10870 [Kordia antarctica]|uniref:Uncharacterized protein n=1 Tax=Kordia antarctica TaxID=1218801 RepID=A0A7L4ZH41_9FLAO|nr:hypothetical protein [Kordia antarctica]QHI35739.1 hypothetical protein IMCC3317_10870 [Kordia antarctica]